MNKINNVGDKMNVQLRCKYCGVDIKMEYTYCPRCGKLININDYKIENYQQIIVNWKQSHIFKKVNK